MKKREEHTDLTSLEQKVVAQYIKNTQSTQKYVSRCVHILLVVQCKGQREEEGDEEEDIGGEGDNGSGKCSDRK